MVSFAIVVYDLWYKDLSNILEAFLIKQLFHSLVGYEMIIANLALHASLAIYNLISNTLLWIKLGILLNIQVSFVYS